MACLLLFRAMYFGLFKTLVRHFAAAFFGLVFVTSVSFEVAGQTGTALSPKTIDDMVGSKNTETEFALEKLNSQPRLLKHIEKIKHDLDHEVYLDPKDQKEHINHGMLEYKKSELEEVHADYEYAHKDDVVEPNEGKINDWHTRHEDKHLEIYCDNHPDALECRVYDD